MGIHNGLLIQRASSGKGSELLQYLGIPLLQETNNLGLCTSTTDPTSLSLRRYQLAEADKSVICS
jgi:hypothetical protein